MSRQSTKTTKKITALYPRINREDNSLDESYSIVNQKKLLQDVAQKMNPITTASVRSKFLKS
jgi:hypothetical protein